MIAGAAIALVIYYLVTVSTTDSYSGSIMVLREQGQVERVEDKLFYYPVSTKMSESQFEALSTLSNVYQIEVITPI